MKQKRQTRKEKEAAAVASGSTYTGPASIEDEAASQDHPINCGVWDDKECSCGAAVDLTTQTNPLAQDESDSDSTAPAQAGTKDERELDGFRSPESSNVHSATYDKAYRVCQIMFTDKKGGEPVSCYNYGDLLNPFIPQIWEDFKKAESKGRFLDQKIKAPKGLYVGKLVWAGEKPKS